jgi:hypothetical protein
MLEWVVHVVNIVLQELTKNPTIRWKMEKWWKEKDFEENSSGSIEVLSRHLPGGTGERHESLRIVRVRASLRKSPPTPEY